MKSFIAPFIFLLGLTTSVGFTQYTTLDHVRQHGALVLGLDPNNRPYSSAEGEPPGFDREIAQKIAEHLGVELKPFWVFSQHFSYSSKLTKNKCDGLMGVPPGSLNNKTKGLDYTKPYYGTGFLLAVRKGEKGIHSFVDLKGKTVGLETGVVVENLKGHIAKEYPSQAAVLAALDQGEIAAGYVGAVQAGWLLKNNPAWKVELLKELAPQDHWNPAIAVRAQDRELKAALDKAIQEMLDQHEIEPIFGKYGIPFYSPFE